VKVRRSLVLALVLSLLTPLGAEAQSLEKSLPRIGYLSVGSESHREAAFRQGLRALGYIDGKNITIEYRFAEGDDNRLSGFASELVRLNVNIIVVSSSQAIQAAQQATQVVPIVMALSGDIGETGAVASLARPGGNMTGLTTTSPELSGKRLALLKEAVPKLSRVAVLVNPRNPIAAIQLRATEPAGRGLGLQIQVLEAKGPDEFEKAFQAAARGRVDALIGLPDTMFVVHRKRLAELGATHRLPTMYGAREHPEAGSLMSYGPDVSDMHRRAAAYVDKILKGAKPGDLPIEQPTKFDFVINLKTAKALGLTIPPSLLLRADEIIQ